MGSPRSADLTTNGAKPCFLRAAVKVSSALEVGPQLAGVMMAIRFLAPAARAVSSASTVPSASLDWTRTLASLGAQEVRHIKAAAKAEAMRQELPFHPNARRFPESANPKRTITAGSPNTLAPRLREASMSAVKWRSIRSILVIVSAGDLRGQVGKSGRTVQRAVIE